MPKIKSAKKALRQNIRRRKQNLLRKDKIKEAIKSYRGFLEGKKLTEAKVILPKIYKTLDKMAKVGFIKPNKANRLKSRLAKKLAKS
ncbi:MAG: 30S ribosomal protein S20 [Candidatus Jorgensenbacteria bacterium GW2011_GWA1_48_13]|uniref:Small ribosomal subunit protein bS20 n=2 Tax=Candidatus Joergenseniibacteriota TaxID=1752739 RepID=A0A0G1YJY3_9BACT|nr:MAG: 30S ribosomal protein S20 [Candidatus Jorgensenbacteria bacterium GW2011_GWA1_48_13]KKU98942.1 MAG: 30S ribosomal protein S20 [Candidatus Jorgensenbacteria bacterium GW2011_GWC1_48_8]KKW15312.1 MAG: 30S ribosomal protein S20 [Candidatus Jorgensenbacteria bacterium GW2011_GWB1_50_10]